MNLLEFFGGSSHKNDESDHLDPRSHNHKAPKVDQDKMADDLYWFMLDHDKLHKECFLPVARELSEKIKTKTLDRKEDAKKFMPMINRACMEFYKQYQMTEDPKDVFTKEMRRGLCKRLADQSFEDIEKDEYSFGNQKTKEMMAPPSKTTAPPDGNLRLESKNPDEENVVDLNKERESKKLKIFHKNFMSDIRDRTDQLNKLIAKYKEAGKFPFEVGTRFSTDHSRRNEQPPWTVTGYYINSKDPENNYGYFVERNTNDGVEKGQHAIRSTGLEKLHGPEKWAEIQAGYKEFKPLKSISERKKSVKQRLDPKCWKGYRKSGTKIKGGVRVNNCVKISEVWENKISNLINILEKKY